MRVCFRRLLGRRQRADRRPAAPGADRGAVHQHFQRLRHRGGISSLLSGYWAIKSGEFDIGVVLGFDKHPAAPSTRRTRRLPGLPLWYGETGMMLTTQFFAMKIRRLYGPPRYQRNRPADRLRSRRYDKENGQDPARLAAASQSASTRSMSSDMVSDP